MRTFITLTICLLLDQFALAQSSLPKGFKEQRWQANRLKFLLPTSMKVITNTPEELLAENKRIKFDIFAVNEEVKDAESYLRKVAAALENTAAPQKTFLPEFDAWVLEGDFLDDKSMMCLLLDPKNPRKNYLVQINYGKGVSKETAITMLGTISKM
jgi:hypothetical protein